MRTGKRMLSAVAATFMILTAGPALAHFGTIIPSDDIVTQDDAKTVNIEVKFIHPLEQHFMEMAKPKQFGVMHGDKKTDLLATLKEAKGSGPDQAEKFTFWTADYPDPRRGTIPSMSNRPPTGNRPRISSSSTTPRSASMPWGSKKAGTSRSG